MPLIIIYSCYGSVALFSFHVSSAKEISHWLISLRGSTWKLVKRCDCLMTNLPDVRGAGCADLNTWVRDIFKRIFLNENGWFPIKISMKFIPKGLVNNIPALVQIMAWHRPGDKPLSEPMMVSLPTHICVARPQWVNEKTTYVQIEVGW